MLLSVIACVVYYLALYHLVYPLQFNLQQQQLNRLNSEIANQLEQSDEASQRQRLLAHLGREYGVSVELYDGSNWHQESLKAVAGFELSQLQPPHSDWHMLQDPTQVMRIRQPRWSGLPPPEVMAFMLVVMFFYGPAICSLVYWTEKRFRSFSTQIYGYLGADEPRSASIDSPLQILHAESTAADLGRNLAEMVAHEQQVSQDAQESLRTTAHEIRRPLNRMVFAIENIKQQATNVEHRLTDQLQDAVSEIVEVVDDILWHARLVHGRVPLRREWFDVESVVREAVAKCESSCPQQQFKVIEGGATPTDFSADRRLLERALMNLLTNAAHYGNGRIETRWRWHCDTLEIIVEDDGTGISVNEREQVLQPFYHGSQRRDGRQTGLGLSIVNGICNAHGGEITIDQSRLGGACICLTLPFGRSND
ncbi:MAG: hypothetical protein Tsb002_18750 [Wenzhouxiangellaceae bacterium]